MSLGLRLLRRAQPESCRAKELSLVSRGAPYRIRQWISTSHDPKSTTQQQPVGSTELPNPDRDATSPQELEQTQSKSAKKTLSNRKRIEKQIRNAGGQLPNGWFKGMAQLTEAPSPQSNKHALERSARKLNDDIRKQQLYAHRRKAYDKVEYSWQNTLTFLEFHTPRFGTMFEFKVFLRGDVAAQARREFAGWQHNIGQIEARHEAKIQIEEISTNQEDLAISISGSERAVRASLLEITEAAGRLIAVRVLDVQSRQLLANPLPGSPEAKLRLLQDGDSDHDTKEGKTIEIQGEKPEPLLVSPYTSYRLKTRADAIQQPSPWTRSSFEDYVAALTFSRVRRFDHFKLYAHGPTHQEVVAKILQHIFLSDDTRAVISVPALKLALFFLQERGLGYRHISRAIFQRAEELDLPLDSTVYNLFLRGASKNDDLDNYNSILRTMVRKGFYPKSTAWIAFLEMTKSQPARGQIINIIRGKELDRSELLKPVVTGETALTDLERCLDAHESQSVDVREWAQRMTQTYGSSWLQRTSLRRAINLLTRRGMLPDARALLHYSADKGVTGDHLTLNTIIAYGNRILDHVEMLKLWETHWPSVHPDDVTYSQLFQIAWTKFCPNMIRVIWRYAVFTYQENPAMNYKLSKILWTRAESKKVELYRAWKGVIFGASELAAVQADETIPLTPRKIAGYHREQASGKRPSLPLSEALLKAYEMDQEIHRRAKEENNKFLSEETMKELTMAIPLESSAHFPVELRDGNATKDLNDLQQICTPKGFHGTRHLYNIEAEGL